MNPRIFRGWIVTVESSWWKALREKSFFLFPNVLKRWSFQKYRSGIPTFFYYEERWYLLYTKNERWSFLKKYVEIYFLQIFWKDGPSKTIALEDDLSCCIYLERWYFSFSKIWPYSLDGTRKTIFLKNNMEICFFLQMPRKYGISKKMVQEHGVTCTIWKDGISFAENMLFFVWTENKTWSFSRNSWKYDIFCIYA